MTTKLITTRRCMVCGDDGTLELPVDGIAKYEGGAFVQDAFPELPKDLREQIISGTHPQCWNDLFGSFDDEEEEELA